ncbi:MAG TPA: type II toxin-antitoxin system VapC family toxin [Pyrinomonadaceae bacterium]|nr:type II toxin-antitoxin system VapC family toxin [Pyrinomonadaceae bacterium]
MTAYYIESSAMVKRYAKEKGTNFLIGLLRPSAKNFLYSAKITEVEVCAALARRQKGLTLAANQTTKSILRFRRIFARRFFAVDLTDIIINEAVRLTEIYALRGYDSVQPATALIANRKRLNDGLTALIFISADNELNNAAQSENLAVENPNNYR